MGLDIRQPIGLLFSIFGALLVAFGIFSNHAIYARSLGVNVNLWWGLVMLAFGVIMLWLGRRKPGSQKNLRSERGESQP